MAEPTSKAHKVYASYWSIVWEQFRKNTPSYMALWGVFLLFFLAIYAPVFSSKMPFFWKDETGVSFPWLQSLLFNRNVFSSSIDLFFNLLLVATPFVIISELIFRRRTRGLEVRDRAKKRRNFVLGWIAFIIVVFICLMQIEPRTALLEYRALALQSPEDISAFFPPLRIDYGDTLHSLENQMETILAASGNEGAAIPGFTHVLGLDDAGRDIFVRLLYGTRVSLAVGVIAVSIYIVLGVILGSVAGYFGGLTDIIISRVIEIFLCIPRLLLILTLVGFMTQPSIVMIMVIIGLIGWTGPARLVRGEFLRLKNIDFVAAARACGLSNQRIIFRHILPNAMGPVLVNATFGVASAILIESTLAFLGLGDPTLPSWGRILFFGRQTGDNAMMLIAGMCIFITVSTFNLAGEGIRDALDPKLRK